MFPGTAHEMTNMYHLDGSSLVLTHYCGMGNQPRMRAVRGQKGRLEFRYESITDHKSPDEPYMGQLTLVVIDPDHIREEWTAFRGGKVDHRTTFALARAR
jgi:hypothetical protein